ncbi:MAG: hypothetical protein GX423_12335, partial [Nitrospiraceae bacterium]|nr:hypothetical protein [Nitrospiraceae bacterium]
MYDDELLTAQLGLNLTIAPELCQGREMPQPLALICFFYRGINRETGFETAERASFQETDFQEDRKKQKSIGESYRYMNIFNEKNKKLLFRSEG